ncbi:MAG: hypothetical protein L0K86_13030 [Actinomycetia bacterium]|nr:hypothetical protein [Actinomycetes bacterium]
MFDHAMWIAYLSLGVASGLLGIALWHLASRDSSDPASLHAGGTTLLCVGAVCAWLAPIVALPDHTGVIVVLTVIIAMIVIGAFVVGDRLAYRKLLRSRPPEART